MKQLFVPKDVSKLVNISYRQAQYWDTSNFIKPSYRRKGRFRMYTFTDLVQLYLAKKLRDRQYSIQRLRVVIKRVRSLLLPQLSSATCHSLQVVVLGDEAMVVNGEMVMTPGIADQGIVLRTGDLADKINEMWPEHAGAASAPL